jgi:hypothetical protein
VGSRGAEGSGGQRSRSVFAVRRRRDFDLDLQRKKNTTIFLLVINVKILSVTNGGVCLSLMGVCHFSLTTLQPHSSVLAFRSHFFRNVSQFY